MTGIHEWRLGSDGKAVPPLSLPASGRGDSFMRFMGFPVTMQRVTSGEPGMVEFIDVNTRKVVGRLRIATGEMEVVS
jgi:hypothetical protein